MIRAPVPLTLTLAVTLALPACTGGTPEKNATSADPTAGEPEAVSLLGEPLYAPAPDPVANEALERNLAEARAAYARDPNDADAILWLGRRLAYLGRYREAIATFSEGIRKHPDDPRFYRHRGHRWITVREFDRAIADLDRAAALVRGRPDRIEPDGIPNAFNIPRTTLQFNIWYHLGLAHYLKGDFARARAAFDASMNVATNDDMIVAAADWLYMTLRRLGRTEEAAAVLARVYPDMEILENHAYHRRLLMYKGLLSPDGLLADAADPLQRATRGYAVGNWHLYNGDTARAADVFRNVLSNGVWSAFGHIAAEAELSRM
ncbi:MAG TPA: tetratricopeptide repeat protein [Longimicrobiales bacterium]